MARIICITGLFPIYRKGIHIRDEFVVSHGICEETFRNIILPNDSPQSLGAKFDSDIGEWVIDDSACNEHRSRA